MAKVSLLSQVQLARRLVSVMDTKFSIFGIKFGIDPILDMIPGFGDTLGAAISCYLLWLAYKLKVPRWVYGKMLLNIGFDYLLGLLPFAGIVLDLFFRANVKNFALLEKFFDPEILEGELIES